MEIGELGKKFEEVVNFHNNMVTNKIVYIEKNVLEVQKNIDKLKDELDIKLDKESRLIKLISNKEALGDYENLNLKLQDKNREKGFKEGLVQNIRDVKLQLDKKSKECDNLNQIIGKFITDYKENLKEFNSYFSSYSEKLYGEKYYLTTKEKINITHNYILNIGNMTENMGTGKKKAQISALDIAYLRYSEKKGLDVPYFVLHDQLETVFENQIDTLFSLASNIDSQFIVAVLSDKLKNIDKKTIINNTIVTLSQDDKLLKI